MGLDHHPRVGREAGADPAECRLRLLAQARPLNPDRSQDERLDVHSDEHQLGGHRPRQRLTHGWTVVNQVPRLIGNKRGRSAANYSDPQPLHEPRDSVGVVNLLGTGEHYRDEEVGR